MVELELMYYEIMDVDFTGVRVRVISGEEILAEYQNFERGEMPDTVYANQTESFLLADVEAARAFIESSGDYTRLR